MQVQTSELVGYRAYRKRCTSVHSLLLSRQKMGRKTEKSQIGLKTSNICQNLFFRIQNLFIFRTTNLKNSYSNSTGQSMIFYLINLETSNIL